MAGDTWGRLVGVIRDVFGDDIAVTPATTAADVDGWDSLLHVQLMVAVEREFCVRFATAELTGPANVGELAAVIDRRRGPGGGGGR